MSAKQDTPRLCECGCGERPPLAVESDASNGLVKGQPRKYVPGHYHNRDPKREFWKRVRRTDLCWLWVGHRTPDGYGRIMVRRRRVLAHVLAYELFVGEIPEGLEIDHLCRNRACVNPEHLELVTRAENWRRGYSPPAVNRRKTHCKRGHPLSGANLYAAPRGGRECRECVRLSRAR